MKSKPSLSGLALCLVFWAVPIACLTKGAGTGVGLNPLANPSPGGMAGPADSGFSLAGASEKPSDESGGEISEGGSSPGDLGKTGNRDGEGPSTVSDSPITVVGQPTGFTPKNPECLGHYQVKTCFKGIAVQADGLPDSDGRPLYRVSGEYIEQVNGGAWMEVVTECPLEIFDLLYPESPAALAKLAPSGFQFFVYAPAGRAVRLEAKHCGRIARVDFELPDPSEPLSLNPCDHPDVADFEDPDYTPTEEETPPALPAPPGPFWVDPFPRDPIPSPIRDEPIEWDGDSPKERKAGFWRPRF
jgi:hypothetical protein